jgi:uncharacterized membrane protein YcaP (DUF421 family)
MPEYILILVRSLFSFIAILILARLMGKKQISQLTFFDYIVGISIGNMAASIAIDPNISMVNGFLGLIIWAILPILLAFIAQKSYRFRQLVEGTPTVLIENGKILEENLKKEKLSVEDLMISLREKNAFKLSDVEFAVMELNGKISSMKKTDAQPVTPRNLGLMLEEDHNPRIVIIDGNVMERSLEDYGYSKEWLLGEIIKQGASDFSDVFLAQIDSKGNIYVDLYHDKVKLPQIKQRPLVAASLKKVQADLENFALQTNNQNAKQMYQEHAEDLKKMVKNLNSYLKE